MAVYRIQPKPGEEPHKWKVEKFAEIGWNETFVRHVTELCTIVDATLIFDQQREGVKTAIMTILTDGLMPAFQQLEKIRATHDKQIPLLDRREMYHDFCRKVWKSYKDLTQRAATRIGFDIGFLFKKDSEFEGGVKEFQKAHSDVRPGVGEFWRKNREQWQNELALFRNTFLEHQDADPKKFGKFYNHRCVETLFDLVWNAIVETIAALLEARLPYGTKLAVPNPDIQPNWPNRYVFDVPHFRNQK